MRYLFLFLVFSGYVQAHAQSGNTVKRFDDRYKGVQPKQPDSSQIVTTTPAGALKKNITGPIYSADSTQLSDTPAAARKNKYVGVKVLPAPPAENPVDQKTGKPVDQTITPRKKK